MKKYKYKAKVFIASIIGIVLSVILYLLIEDFSSRLILIFSAGFALINLFRTSLEYYTLTESKLVFQGAFSKKELRLDEVISIGVQYAGKFVGESFIVASKDKKISITALTLEHWELISHLISALPDLEKVKIDEYVSRRVG